MPVEHENGAAKRRSVSKNKKEGKVNTSHENHIVGCADLPYCERRFEPFKSLARVKRKGFGQQKEIRQIRAFGVEIAYRLHAKTRCLSVDKAHSDVHDFAVSSGDLRIADFFCCVDTAHQNFHSLLLQASYAYFLSDFARGFFCFPPCLQTYNMIYCVPK